MASYISHMSYQLLVPLPLSPLPCSLEANNTEDYVHRIGRTGRAGAKGYAVTFLCPSEDGGKISGIIQATKKNLRVPSEAVIVLLYIVIYCYILLYIVMC